MQDIEITKTAEHVETYMRVPAHIRRNNSESRLSIAMIST